MVFPKATKWLFSGLPRNPTPSGGAGILACHWHRGRVGILACHWSFEALAPRSAVSPCSPKRHLVIAKPPHPVSLVLIFKIDIYFYINNIALNSPEVGDATLYNTDRASLRGSNHVNSGVRPLSLPRKLSLPRNHACQENQIKRNTPAGGVAAGKWLEPPVKGQEGDAICCKTARKIVTRITYINHKSLVLMHITAIPAAPKGRKTSIP